MADDCFDNLTDIYESIIDWPKRLAHEEPLYRRLFERVETQSLLDVACGTGRHAAMFHEWGLRVEAADVSPHMIDRARCLFGQVADLHWVVRRFDQPWMPEEPFDVAICVGNSLALASDMAVVGRAIRQMLSAVRNGGAIVVHVLNLWRLPDGPCIWQKHCRAELPSGEVLIAKGVHRSGTRGFVDLLVTPLDAPEKAYGQSVPLVGIEAASLREMAIEAGRANRVVRRISVSGLCSRRER